MGERIGLLAGSGNVPALILEELESAGLSVCAAAIRGEADSDRPEEGSVQAPRFGYDRISDLIAFFQKNDVSGVLFAGKFEQRRFLANPPGLEPGLAAALPPAKTATGLIDFAIRYFEMNGLPVLDPSPYLKSADCLEGPLTGTPVPETLRPDIRFGFDIAKTLADRDIGQSVVVKQGAVAAVEGLEGTDEAVLRGGRLAGPGTVVVKVARSDQDPRIDWPAVGLETIKSCIEAGSAALCIEARRVLFFQKEAALDLAEKKGLCVLAESAGHSARE